MPPTTIPEDDRIDFDEMNIKVVDTSPSEDSLENSFKVSATLPDPDYDPDSYRKSYIKEGRYEFAFLVGGNLYEEILDEPVIELKPEYREKLQKARQILDDPTVKPFMVGESQIWYEGYRGQGVGTKLYVHAVRYVAKFNGVLFPHACQEGGTLNAMAERVWKGDTFQFQINMFDDYMASAIQLD